MSKYKKDDRVSFIYKFAKHKIKHFVGYVKAVRKSLFGAKYVINVAKSDEIYIVRKRDIFGLVEWKETKQTNQINKQNK